MSRKRQPKAPSPEVMRAVTSIMERSTGVPVEREPDDFPLAAHIQEECCFCRKPTRYWTALADRKPGQQVACCQPCAAAHKPSDVPTKDAWWDYTPGKPTPSPLARVRWALERVRDDSLLPVHEALDALTTLEAALSDLMDAWHYTMPHERGPDGWRGCARCLAKLEGK